MQQNTYIPAAAKDAFSAVKAPEMFINFLLTCGFFIFISSFASNMKQKGLIKA